MVRGRLLGGRPGSRARGLCVGGRDPGEDELVEAQRSAGIEALPVVGGQGADLGPHRLEVVGVLRPARSEERRVGKVRRGWYVGDAGAETRTGTGSRA